MKEKIEAVKLYSNKFIYTFIISLFTIIVSTIPTRSMKDWILAVKKPFYER